MCTHTHNNPPYCLRVLSDITQKSDGLQWSAEAHIFSFPSDAIRKLLKRTPVYSQVLPCEKWRKKLKSVKPVWCSLNAPWTFPPHQQRMRMQNAILLALYIIFQRLRPVDCKASLIKIRYTYYIQNANSSPGPSRLYFWAPNRHSYTSANHSARVRKLRAYSSSNRATVCLLRPESHTSVHCSWIDLN